MGRGELDRWARVLGVANDADAIVELEDLYRRLDELLAVVHLVEIKLRHVPDEELAETAHEATEDALRLYVTVGAIKRKFEQHVRGGDQ